MRLPLFLWIAVLPVCLSAQVFMRPVDHAASLALGGASVAYPGLEIGLGNDAMAGMRGQSGALAGSAIPYGISGWSTATLQGFLPIGASNGVGAEINISGIPTYREQRYRLLYGRRLAEKVWLGGSVHVLRVAAPEYGNASTATFSLGVLANPVSSVWLGAMVQNPFQQEMAGTVLPAVLRLGAAWCVSATLTMLAEVEKDLDYPSQVKAGVEYRPARPLVLRMGVRTGPGRVCFGAGLRIQRNLEIGTAAEWHPDLGLTPAAMLVWRKKQYSF